MLSMQARKSTEDEERQIRSIQDQITECTAVAKAKGLKVVDIITETKSAKEPGVRNRFNEMIKSIEAERIDGIIAWHPDRLSRNMREAGVIIDLLDKRIIKDLQFYATSFENSATGKMLLGITFVLSKHYSDNLSDNVKRGNRRSIFDGKFIGHQVHGYYKDRNQYLQPDTNFTPNNYSLIQRAWEMKLEGNTLDEIADYLNENNYHVAREIGGTKHVKSHITKAKLSTLFKQSVYAGILDFGSSNPVDLTAIPEYQFQPMITPDGYIKVYGKNNFAKLKKGRGKGTVKADLLRGMVFCDNCKEPMSTGLTTKKDKDGQIHHYFYFRCDTSGCKFQHKNARAIIVTDFVLNFLENNKLVTQESYEEYKRQGEKLAKTKTSELISKKYSLLQKIRQDENTIELTKKLLIQPDIDTATRKTFEGDLGKLQESVDRIKEEIEKKGNDIARSKETILDQAKFIELFESLPQILRQNRDLEWQNYIIKKIFSNFYISMEDGTGFKSKIVRFELNKPFDSLLKSQKVCGGRIY